MATLVSAAGTIKRDTWMATQEQFSFVCLLEILGNFNIHNCGSTFG